MKLLGHMWQELPKQEKDAYLLVTCDSLRESTGQRHRHRKLIVTVPPASPESPTTVSYEHESTPFPMTYSKWPAGEVHLRRVVHHPVLLSITSRGAFDLSAAEASKWLIHKCIHGDDDLMSEGRLYP
jgi:hypothetical protein